MSNLACMLTVTFVHHLKCQLILIIIYKFILGHSAGTEFDNCIDYNDTDDELSDADNSSLDSSGDSTAYSYDESSQTDNDAGANDTADELSNFDNSSQDSSGDSNVYSDDKTSQTDSDRGANDVADDLSSVDSSKNNPLLAKNVDIEIMASDNVTIKKGDKVVVTCNIYSKTTCVINQALVSSQHVKPSRARRNCPIKGCHAAALLKLSNHLRQTHKIKNSNTIRKYLNLAKLVSI